MKRRLVFIGMLLALTVVFTAEPVYAAGQTPSDPAADTVLTRAGLDAIAAGLNGGTAAEQECGILQDSKNSPDAVITMEEAAAFLVNRAGMSDEQISGYTYADDAASSMQNFTLAAAGQAKDKDGNDFSYDLANLVASLGLADGIDYRAQDPVTISDFQTMLGNTEDLYASIHAAVRKPLFAGGEAQPVFDYGKTVRYCVYVETNYDTDGDGKRDLVKAVVNLPGERMNEEGGTAAVFEARPYITGTVDDSQEIYAEGAFDEAGMLSQPAPRVPEGTETTADIVRTADPSDWYYESPLDGQYYYEDLNWYDYYLVRGFAVVECGGLGTKGSEGFECCGTDLETDAFKCVIEWLHGDRIAYASPDSAVSVRADWCNGRVGMTGRSYAGTTQFGLAATGVPGLETIVPVAGIASWYDYYDSQGSTSYTTGISDLSLFCSGRYLDPADWKSVADRYGRYLTKTRNAEIAENGDYGPFWKVHDYTIDPSRIRCSALIVHGLNDQNVRAKQFDLMYRACQKSGVLCKLLLHQGTHITPAYPTGGYAIDVAGQSYNSLLNRWFSHYLYNVPNGVEKMAAVTVQSNVDGSWKSYDQWNDAAEQKHMFAEMPEGSEPVSTVTGSESSPSVGTEYTIPVSADMLLKGTAEVHIRAKTAAPAGSDNVIMETDLYDEADTPFGAYIASVGGNMYVPVTTLMKDGAWMGGGLDNYDSVSLQQTSVTTAQIKSGQIDLYNPTAGYDAASASVRTELQPDTWYDYTVYIDPTVYTVKAGHRIRLSVKVLQNNVNVTIDNSHSYVLLPEETAK
jgi:X-Pro dipeptidyl-peptidase